MAKASRQEMRRLLWHWGRLDEYCQAKQREIETYNELVARNTDISAAVLNGLPHGSDMGNPTLKAAIKLEELARLYAEAVEEAKESLAKELRLKKRIDELLDDLSEAQREIIRLRYKGGHAWAYIGIKMAFDEDYSKQLEANAVDKLSKRIKTTH